MNYLTVPDAPSTPQMEKPLVKDEQAPQGLRPGGPGRPTGVPLGYPGSSLPTAEISTVLHVTSGLPPPYKAEKGRKSSSRDRPRRDSKQISRSINRPRTPGKSHRRRRRHRKRRRLTLQEVIERTWGRIKPYLIYFRKIIYDLTQSFFFDILICTVVGINTIMLVAQTFAEVEIRGGWFFSAMDARFLCVYVVEAILKLIALDLDYFRDLWNDVDFVIMITAVLDFVLPLFITQGQGNRSNTVTLFRVLKICKAIRAIRAIRFLLTLRVLQNLQEVTSTFVLSCQSIGAIILLIFVFLAMSSVVLRDMFEEADPKHFGDLFNTIFTLFQFFTLDDWSLIYLTCYSRGAWYIILFLIVYILVQYFLLLNLVIAVLVDNFQMALVKRQELKKQKKVIQPEESSIDDIVVAKRAERAKTKEDEEEFFRWMVQQKYGSLELTNREWQLLYSYFRLMTSIEKDQLHFRSQAYTSDKIVDTFFETGEAEYPRN